MWKESLYALYVYPYFLVFLPWIDIMFTIPLGPIYRQKESLETGWDS